jgi:hypothetical protein
MMRIILAIVGILMLGSTVYAINNTSVVGTQLKQEGTVLYEADDITAVVFDNFSLTGTHNISVTEADPIAMPIIANLTGNTVVFENISSSGNIQTERLLVNPGSSSIPSVKVGNEENGLSSPSPNTVAISAGGNEIARAETTGLTVEGVTEDVVSKNQTTVFLQDTIGNYLIHQPTYWDGDSYEVANNYGFGHLAQESNTGANSNGFGYSAQRYNTGVNSNGFGYSAQQSNTGVNSNGFGTLAQQSNTGANSNGVGDSAQRYNTGANSNGFGILAQQSNTGANSNGVGYLAQESNTGANSNGVGYLALRFNTGANSNGVGTFAQESNTGANSNGFGYSALRYNQNIENIAIGNNAWSTFIDDTSGNKTFAYTDIDAGTDRITVTSHGFGATNAFINIKYTEGTSAITGLSNGTIYQVKIIDASTIGFYESSRGTNITDAGTGTGHTFTPQYDYSNTIVIGADTIPTGSNQVILGNTNVTDTYLNGNITAPGSMEVAGQANFANISSSGNLKIAGTSDLDGAVTMSSTLDVLTGDFEILSSGYVNIKQKHAVLHESSDPPSFYNFTTANVFYQWTSANATTFHTYSGDLKSITLDDTSGAHYIVNIHAITEATLGVEYTAQLLKDGVSILDVIHKTDQFSGKIHNPAFINLSTDVATGADAAWGTYSSFGRLNTIDGSVVNIVEANGACNCGYNLKARYDNVNEPNRVTLWAAYDGSGPIEARAWNDTLSQWDELRTETADIPGSAGALSTDYVKREFFFPVNSADYVNASDEVFITLINTGEGGAGKIFDVDKLVIDDRIVSMKISSLHHLAIEADSTLTLGIKSDAPASVYVRDAGIFIGQWWQ